MIVYILFKELGIKSVRGHKFSERELLGGIYMPPDSSFVRTMNSSRLFLTDLDRSIDHGSCAVCFLWRAGCTFLPNVVWQNVSDNAKVAQRVIVPPVFRSLRISGLQKQG